MTTAKNVMKMIKDNDVKYVDFRFTDPRGKWQHVTFDVTMIEEETFAEGQMFDGSSIAGWKAINESDMNLMPDPATACIDPFFAETTMSLVCDVLEPTTGEPYNRDPRGIAKKAEGMVKSMGVGDTIFFGPEAEFFVFDDVKYAADPYNTGFKLDSIELPSNSDTEYEGGNLGHRIGTKKGYFPVPPQDSAQDMRSEMLGAMARMGCVVEKHHHEVASRPARTRPEVLAAHRDGRPDADLQILHPAGGADLRQDRDLHAQADLRRQRLGHALPPVDLEGAASRCSRATNMPTCRRPACPTSPASSSTPRRSTPSPTRPPTPTSVWCRASRRRCCSPTRRATARRRAAFPTRPTRRPSASRCVSPIRSPIRISAFAAMLMAGLDGIKNKLDPGSAMDKDLYDLPPAELKKIPTVCGSLRQALGELDKDRAFLKAGGVFDDDFIDSYIDLKMPEVIRFEHTPHPVEFDMYYSA